MRAADTHRIAEVAALAGPRLPFVEYPAVLTELRHADPLVSSHPSVEDFLCRMRRRLLGFPPSHLIASVECVLKWPGYMAHPVVTDACEQLEGADLSVHDSLRLLRIASKMSPAPASLVSRLCAQLEKTDLIPRQAVDVLTACAAMSHRPSESLRVKLSSVVGINSTAANAYAQLGLLETFHTVWSPSQDFSAVHPAECVEWLIACAQTDVAPPVALVDALVVAVELLRPEESLDVAAALTVSGFVDSVPPFLDAAYGDDEKMHALFLALKDRLPADIISHLEVEDAWEERPLCNVQHPDAEYVVLVDDFYTVDLVVGSVAVDVYPNQIAASVWQRLKGQHLAKRGYRPLFLFKDWYDLPREQQPDIHALL